MGNPIRDSAAVLMQAANDYRRITGLPVLRISPEGTLLAVVEREAAKLDQLARAPSPSDAGLRERVEALAKDWEARADSRVPRDLPDDAARFVIACAMRACAQDLRSALSSASTGGAVESTTGREE